MLKAESYQSCVFLEVPTLPPESESDLSEAENLISQHPHWMLTDRAGRFIPLDLSNWAQLPDLKL